MTGAFRIVALLIAIALGACGQSPENEAGPVVAPSDQPAGLPDTDIYLATLSIDDGRAMIGAIEPAISGPGYANQPYFVGGGRELFFTMEGAGGKTDLWQYALESGELLRITDTPNRSEYSPKPAPQGGVSYIQENEDGEITRVHRDGEMAIEFAPLGYYEWLNGGRLLGVFLRNQPPELHLVNVETGTNERIADQIGRTLIASPDGSALYYSSRSDGVNRIFSLAIDGSATIPVANLPGEGEDFMVVFDGAGSLSGIFATVGNLLVFRSGAPGTGEGWEIVYDFSEIGVPSRIAISTNQSRMAIVVDPPS